MGSTHRAHLILSGGGEKLHETERQAYQRRLINFLDSQGVDKETSTAALAHFDIGYDDGYSGESPFYSDEWDEGV